MLVEIAKKIFAFSFGFIGVKTAFKSVALNFYILKSAGLALSFCMLIFFKHFMAVSDFAYFAKYTRYSELFLILFSLGFDKKLFKDANIELQQRSLATSLIAFLITVSIALLLSVDLLLFLAIFGGFLKLSIRYRSVYMLFIGSKTKAVLYENYLLPLSLLFGFALFDRVWQILLFSLVIVLGIFSPYLLKAFKALFKVNLNRIDLHITLTSVIGYLISKSDAVLLDLLGANSVVIGNVFFMFSVFAFLNFAIVFQFQNDLSLYKELNELEKIALFLEKRRKRKKLIFVSLVFIPTIIIYSFHWAFILYFLATIYSIAMSYTGHILIMCGLADKLWKIQTVSFFFISLCSLGVYLLGLEHYYLVLVFAGSIFIENYLKNSYVINYHTRLTA